MDSETEAGGAGINNKEILDVRKVIERSTSKVSLRDLEKKGFRQVKVLRAGDINQLIYKAVQTVLAKNPVGGGVSETERQRILDEAKQEYERQLKAAQQAQQALQKLETEKQAVEARGQEVEEAKKRLEQKVNELNTQLVGRQRSFDEDKKKFEVEKKKLEEDKQRLYEKGLDTVNAATKHYQTQIEELKAKLDQAEAKAAAAQGAVSQDAYHDLEQRAKDLESRAKTRVEALEKELRTANHELELARADLEHAKAEPKSDPAEVQKLREELAEKDARLGEMLTTMMSKLKETPAPAAAGMSPDMEKQFKSFAQGLTDQMRKIAGSAARGSGSSWGDESGEVSLANINLMGDEAKLETNIKDVAVKEQSAKGVKDKLSKLKNMRGGASGSGMGPVQK